MPPPGAGPQPSPGLLDPQGNPLRSAETAQQQRDLDIRAKLLKAQEDYDRQLQRSVQTLRRGGMSYDEIAQSIGATGSEAKNLVDQMKQWNTITVRSAKDLKELASMPIGEIFERMKEGTLKFAYSTQVSMALLATAGKKMFDIFEKGALTVNQAGAILAAQTGAGMSGSVAGAIGSRLSNSSLQASILSATNTLQSRFHISPDDFRKALAETVVAGGRFLGGEQSVSAAAKAASISPALGLDPAQAARFFTTWMIRTGSSVETTAKRFDQMDRQAQVAGMSNTAYIDSVEKLVDQTYKHGVSLETSTRLVTMFGKELTQGRIQIQDIAQFATGIEGQSPQRRAGLALLARQMGVQGMSDLPTDPLSMMRVLRERAASGAPAVGMAEASQMALRMASQMGTSFENAAELVIPQIFGSLPTEARSRQAIIEKIRMIGDLVEKGASADVLAAAEGKLAADMRATGKAISSPQLESQAEAIAQATTGLIAAWRDEAVATARLWTEAIRQGIQTSDWSGVTKAASPMAPGASNFVNEAASWTSGMKLLELLQEARKYGRSHD